MMREGDVNWEYSVSKVTKDEEKLLSVARKRLKMAIAALGESP